MATEQERNRGAGAYSTPGVDTPASKGPIFETATVTPFLPLKTTNVDPPATLYVTEADVLTLLVWNSFPGLTITLTHRILRAVDGQIVIGQTQFQPATNRVLQTFAETLPSGFLLDIQIGHPGTGPRRGQTFCVLALQRNFPGTSAFGTATLLADYLTQAVTLGWPGGRQISSTEGTGFIKTVTVTNPAAGTDWSIVVPTNARWRVICTDAFFTASAAVANRFARIVFDDGVNQTYVGQPSIAITAGEAVNVSASTSIATNTAGDQEVMAPLPSGQTLLGGGHVKASTNGIQAADQWSGVTVLVEEWIET